MWKFKKCPRCGGDILLDRDQYSWYEQCLQCGYERDLESIGEFEEQPVKKGGEQTPAGRAR